MIGIRSVTYQMSNQINSADLKIIENLSENWVNAYPLLRTQRINLAPCSERISEHDLEMVAKMSEHGYVRWFNVPIDPWETDEKSALFAFASDVIRKYKQSFVNVLTCKNGKLQSDITERSIGLIRDAAGFSDDGKDNFRVGLSLNINANGAFFPFTYSGGTLGFSIALELTQEMNRIIAENPDCSLSVLRKEILEVIGRQIDVIQTKAEELAAKYGVAFYGFDFSLAPIIEPDGSIMPILNRLGITDIEKTGIMFATAYLTDILKSFELDHPHCGFSGVMYSLLEDEGLCKVNNEQGVSLETMIKVSTMCGCGLDMAPIADTIKERELRAVFYEVYAISTRLKKPLGFRALPINCKDDVEPAYTNLHDDVDFISNTKVLRPNVNAIADLGNAFEFSYY